MTTALRVETLSGGTTAMLTVEFEHPPVISLPWKALVPDNQRHDVLRVKGGGRRIGLTEKYRRALSAATLLASHQWGGRPILKSAVAVTITLYEPDKRKRDIGNYVKMTMDALVRVAILDDSQIDRLVVLRGPLSRGMPRAEIQIQAL